MIRFDFFFKNMLKKNVSIVYEERWPQAIGIGMINIHVKCGTLTKDPQKKKKVIASSFQLRLDAIVSMCHCLTQKCFWAN